MKNITIIGTGYVGLVTAVCLAEKGNAVVCVDINPQKIAQLKEGQVPIYEPGLEAILQRNIAHGRLHFVTSLTEQPHQPDIYVIATGTPSLPDGSADLSSVYQVASDIGQQLTDYVVIVDKSTVPVGTSEAVKKIIEEQLHQREVSVSFDVVSNPEFLKEGEAINDFMHPDRVIIGSDSTRASTLLTELYLPFVKALEQILVMSPRDAELAKYACNAFLATKISFMNEMSRLCELMGADIQSIYRGMITDPRIGSQFLRAGCGYGGSCFPKDVKALIHMAENKNFSPLILNAIEKRNEDQKHQLLQKIISRLGCSLAGKTLAVWGLAFKPGTDDLRHAPAVTFIEDAIRQGARIKAFDPVASEAARRYFPQGLFERQQLILVDEPYSALIGAEALVLITEWDEFQSPDFKRIKKALKIPFIVDGRNQYDPQLLAFLGLEYCGFGRKSSTLSSLTLSKTDEFVD